MTICGVSIQEVRRQIQRVFEEAEEFRHQDLQKKAVKVISAIALINGSAREAVSILMRGDPHKGCHLHGDELSSGMIHYGFHIDTNEVFSLKEGETLQNLRKINQWDAMMVISTKGKNVHVRYVRTKRLKKR